MTVHNFFLDRSSPNTNQVLVLSIFKCLTSLERSSFLAAPHTSKEKEGKHAGHKWWKCVGMYRAIEHCGQLVYEELFSLRSCAALKSIRNKKVGVVWVWEFCVGDRKRIGFGNLGRKGCEEIYWANEWHNIQTVNHSVFSTQSETCTYSEGGGSQSSFAFHLHFITARNIKAYRISLGD